MGLIFADKIAIDTYLKDEGIMLNLLERVNKNLRLKRKKYKYPNQKNELVQLTF